MSRVLIFGASGQLGQCLKAVAQKRGMQGLIFPDENQADVLNTEALEELFRQQSPDYVINCAAYTAVDKAEDEVALARMVNRDGASNLGRLSSESGAVLIHVSTDFVFGGNSVVPLKETDPAEPINVYGLTKLEGEAAIAEQTDRYFILRTSWL